MYVYMYRYLYINLYVNINKNIKTATELFCVTHWSVVVTAMPNKLDVFFFFQVLMSKRRLVFERTVFTDLETCCVSFF